MKGKTVVVLLILLGLLAAGGYFAQRSQTLQKKIADYREQLLQVTNLWQSSRRDLDEQRQVNQKLQADLSAANGTVSQLSNKLVSTSSTLAKVEAEAQSAAKAAQEEVAKRDAKIDELQRERDDLTAKMDNLNHSITNLQDRIASTKKQLAASEGDREFLLKQLKRLQAQKSQLEQKFNDLASVQQQVRKLRDALTAARRLEWFKHGFAAFGTKGGQLLQRGFYQPPTETNYNLTVEFTPKGSAKILSNTNAAAVTNAAPVPLTNSAPAAVTNAPTAGATNTPATSRTNAPAKPQTAAPKPSP